MVIDEWSYVLTHKSIYGRPGGGQDFSAQVWRGGAKTWRAIIEGGTF